LFAIRILVTVYLSTSYLSECQFDRTEICDHLVRKATNRIETAYN